MKETLRDITMNYIVPLMIGMILGTSALMLTSMGSIALVPTATLTPDKPFVYSFNAAGELHEASSLLESWSPYWWVNSGGKLLLDGSVGSTIQSDLPSSDKWYKLYNRSNPTDTDGGKHPQNIFRLISRPTWENTRLENWFRVTGDNLSNSSNRNASNGLLLMSRYKDGSTLYYAGVRVDGTSVIKKKYKGAYYTMAQEKLYPGTYNRNSSPNLLPHDEWIGLRLHTATLSDGKVSLRLYMKEEDGRTWTLIASAVDDGKQYGGTPVISGAGHTGIRTDFMDVEFDSFRIDSL